MYVSPPPALAARELMNRRIIGLERRRRVEPGRACQTTTLVRKRAHPPGNGLV